MAETREQTLVRVVKEFIEKDNSFEWLAAHVYDAALSQSVERIAQLEARIKELEHDTEENR